MQTIDVSHLFDHFENENSHEDYEDYHEVTDSEDVAKDFTQNLEYSLPDDDVISDNEFDDENRDDDNEDDDEDDDDDEHDDNNEIFNEDTEAIVDDELQLVEPVSVEGRHFFILMTIILRYLQMLIYSGKALK